MIRPLILHLCADTGSDSYAYRLAGYDVHCIGADIGVENYQPPEDADIYGVFANPVCTEFSVASGFHKENDLDKGMFLVHECQRIIKQADPRGFWVIENPASGRLKEKLGDPQFSYEPWEFGSPWTKRTALWGNFNVPEKLYTKWEDVPKNPNLYVRPGRPKPSLAFLHKSAIQYIEEFSHFEVDSDMEFRSLCSQRFAHAFFAVNNCGVFNDTDT